MQTKSTGYLVGVRRLMSRCSSRYDVVHADDDQYRDEDASQVDALLREDVVHLDDKALQDDHRAKGVPSSNGIRSAR